MAPKLTFLVLDSNSSKPFRGSVISDPQANDMIILIKPPTVDGNPADYKINVVGTSQDLSSKRNMGTAFSTGRDFAPGDFGGVAASARSAEFFIYNEDDDYVSMIRQTIDSMKSINTDSSVNSDILDGLREVFSSGGTVNCSIMDDEGNFPALSDIEIVIPTTTGAATPTFSAATADSIIALIAIVIPAVVYDGFDPVTIRSFFKNKFESPAVATRNLLLAFTAYSFIGNNVGKLAIRRRDLDVSKELMAEIKNMGIVKSDRSREGLTLPRLAIAFMPEYLAFRRFFARELQSQTSSEINVVFKDIAFNGCAQIRNMDGYTQFHKEFSTFIFTGKSNEVVDPEDAKFKKSYEQFSKVAIAGYNKDNKIHARMTTVLGWTSKTTRAVYNFIEGAMVDAYDTP